MRRFILAAGVAASVLTPTLASAQRTCEEHSNNRVVGTVGGAGIGAILGSVIAGRGDKGIGALIGAAGGGLVGNQATKQSGDCARAYGYYDRAGAWHATDVRADQASGYYDREGNWVNGVPAGYYDSNNRYVASTREGERAGYRDQHGHWVPASANGYYDADNSYRAGTVSGYYDNGRWVRGETTGRYDSNGRWIAGAPAARRDANGNWVYDPQPGYYDRGRWVRGETRGYYDTNGTWIAISGSGTQNASYGNNRDYRDGRDAGARDTRSRESRIEERIRRLSDDGTLTRGESSRALQELVSIRSRDRAVSDRNGRKSQRNEAILQSRLDRLNASLRSAREDARASN